VKRNGIINSLSVQLTQKKFSNSIPIVFVKEKFMYLKESVRNQNQSIINHDISYSR